MIKVSVQLEGLSYQHQMEVNFIQLLFTEKEGLGQSKEAKKQNFRRLGLIVNRVQHYLLQRT